MVDQPNDGAPEWHALIAALGDLSDLSKGDVELLVMLAEEASEIIKCAMKCIRAGYEFRPYDGPVSNRDKLEQELSDLYAVVHILQDKGHLGRITVSANDIARRLRYTRHQGYEV